MASRARRRSGRGPQVGPARGRPGWRHPRSPTQEPAKLRVIEGGVEVSGENARTVTGRRQRGQLTAPPGRGARGPGRPRGAACSRPVPRTARTEGQAGRCTGRRTPAQPTARRAAGSEHRSPRVPFGTGCVTQCGSRSPSPARWSLAAASSVSSCTSSTSACCTAYQLDNRLGLGPAASRFAVRTRSTGPAAGGWRCGTARGPTAAVRAARPPRSRPPGPRRSSAARWPTRPRLPAG